MSIAQENGFIYIFVSYINKLYASVVLQHTFSDLNTNDFIGIKVSSEDAVMGMSLFSGGRAISFFKKRIFSSNVATSYIGL